MAKGDRGGKLNNKPVKDYIMRNKAGSGTIRYASIKASRLTAIEKELGAKIYPDSPSQSQGRRHHAQHHVESGDQLTMQETNTVIANGRLFHDRRYPDTIVMVSVSNKAEGSVGQYVVLGIAERPREGTVYLRVRNSYRISAKDAQAILNHSNKRYKEFNNRDY